MDGDWFHYMLHSQNKTYFLYFFSFVIRLKSSECKIWKKCTYCPIWFRPRALSLSNPTKGWSGQLCLLVWLLRSDSKFVSGDMIRSHSQWTGLLVIRLSLSDSLLAISSLSSVHTFSVIMTESMRREWKLITSPQCSTSLHDMQDSLPRLPPPLCDERFRLFPACASA